MERYIYAEDFLDLFYVASAGQDKMFVKVVEQVVEDTPTADVVEVKHGKWKVKVFPLTNCKKVYCDCGYYENKGPAWEMHWGMHNYCPNCGAKMDGKDINVHSD